MASKQAHKRLLKEHSDILKSPPPLVIARPKENNILEWHYIMRGPIGTPYEGGEYWGTVIFPPEYPFKPPALRMHTPSGRFDPGQRICTSMSDYHPDTWNPSWNISSILIALLSFMVSDEIATGSISYDVLTRKQHANKSHAYNISQSQFKSIFPDFSDCDKPKPLPNMGPS